MHPVPVFDRLTFQRAGSGIQLTCNDPTLPTDSRNLVYRAAEAFLKAAHINVVVTLHLEKRIPLAAGLGGGSGNAATTLLGLNEIFGHPLTPIQLDSIAASLGSDIPFFLQDKPALAIGRGEKIRSLDFFPALRGTALLLIHPGFGIATAWAYQQLAKFPHALNGRVGRAQRLISLLQSGDLKSAATQFYNSLETPALDKYPLLALFQEFLRENGAVGALMSGSGSSTFALVESKAAAETLAEKLKQKFGLTNWTSVVTLP
jgi:4-diphosphocytidyl-2-C-methyl-D-erythritol kinase